ncbi:MAG TPA: PadR family transcriptional regulator [Firmicutes bacterium]|nr:PadR family transcriptional regulator [Bacillota bacterium]
MEQNNETALLESLTLELRRGTIVLSVLSQLKTPKYGYLLVTELQDKGMKVDANTLYPLLRRLEKQEILTSSWDTEGTKPRKYYEMSELGKNLFTSLCDIWLEINETMKNLIEG